MTAAQFRKCGFRVNTEKMDFGGHEYAVYRADGDSPITTGWSLGGKRDPLAEAERDLRERGLL